MAGEPSTPRVVAVRSDPRLRREFITFPKRLYRDDRWYVPAFDGDVRALLRRRHPFFQHSDGEFFLLHRGGETVARFLIVENTRYNAAHGTSYAFFDMLDFVDDDAVMAVAADWMTAWARSRGLTAVAGPMLSGGAGGAGVLVEGFERDPAMTMMRYNFRYYGPLLTGVGFEKLVDLQSFSLRPEALRLPERVERLAAIVEKRGRFTVLRFRSKRELRRVVDRVKALYDATFNHHVEDYPLSSAELDQVEKELLTVIDPRHVALLAYDGTIVGFALGFVDLSAVLRRNAGRLGPVEILRLVRGMRGSRHGTGGGARGSGGGKILFNGLGILPEYQGLGGNALLYRELARIVVEGGFTDVEMVQISEETSLMLRDAGTLGGKPAKVHRLFVKAV